jgi:predicted alpha/beta-hydrolase family hydrolase
MALPSTDAMRERVRGLTRRRALGLIGVAALVVVVAGAVGFYVYFGVFGLHAPTAVEESVRADPTVTVESGYGGYVVGDADPGAERLGVVFYPGGRVAPDAYLPTAAEIATRANVTVVVPKMRANLAVFSQGRADAVLAGESDVERWVVGGHSLGGAMACRYAGANDRTVDGLLLVGAYCDRPVSGMPALSVVGTRDAVLNRDRFAETESNLPEPDSVVRIEGMNHSQAGWYAGQSGDQSATIPTPEAHRRLATTVADWLCRDLDHCANGTATSGTAAVESAGRISGAGSVVATDR